MDASYYMLDMKTDKHCHIKNDSIYNVKKLS